MFKTVLPAGFTASDASLPSGDVRVRVLAIQRAERQQAAFIGGILPQEGLAGLADYNLRIKDTTKYLLSSRSTLPNGSVAFEAIDGTMLTVFLVHGNDYAEITITGDPASTNELYNTMSIIQQEWTWK